MRDGLDNSIESVLQRIDAMLFVDELTEAGLPSGYRWATADESEAWTTDPASLPDAIVVKRAFDSTGRPYTEDEADLAVPE